MRPAVLALLCLLSACTPRPDASSTDLSGQDIDHNGVRDDVDRLISSEWRPEQRPAALALARQVQANITAPAGSDATLGFARAAWASTCLLLSSPREDIQASDRLTDAVLNTPQRRAAAKAFMARAGSAGIPLPGKTECAASPDAPESLAGRLTRRTPAPRPAVHTRCAEQTWLQAGNRQKTSRKLASESLRT